MREITTADLFCTEVINLCDGGKLGYPSALEFCAEDGKVTALIIPGRLKWLGLLGREPETVIPWERIQRMGEDIIFLKG